MKLEKRILVLVNFSNFLIGILLRGIKGIEFVNIFNSCREVSDMLLSKKGVAGEISGVIDFSDTCKNELIDAGFDRYLLSLDVLPSRVRVKVLEAKRIAIRIGSELVKGMIGVLRADI